MDIKIRLGLVVLFYYWMVLRKLLKWYRKEKIMEIRVGLVVLFYILLISVVIVIYKILFEKEINSYNNYL